MTTLSSDSHDPDGKSSRLSSLRVAYLAPAKTDSVGGVSRFDSELQRAMARIAQITVHSVLPESGSELRQVPGLGRAIAGAVGTARAKKFVREMEQMGEIDLVFHSFHWPPRISKEVPCIGFIHDLRMIGAHERQSPSWKSGRARMVKYAIDSWDVVCVPSAHVADDVNFLLPWVTPEVVGEGLDHLPGVHSVTRNRILVITGPSAHKRPLIAKDVAIRIHDRYGMPVSVLGLDSGPWAECRDISTLQQVRDVELARVLSETLVCLATSSYEGFGLAVGEAMRAGCPIVYGADSHLEHLVGEAGIAVEPTLEGFQAGFEDARQRFGHLGERTLERSGTYIWEKTARNILFGGSQGVPGVMVNSAPMIGQCSEAVSERDHAPFWTVIIPTHNRSKQLPRALESVLSQSIGDFELLVVDDASDDDTDGILHGYSDVRLKVIRHSSNCGASVSRNTGIQHSRGEYIAFLDSDDYWLPEKLKTLTEAIAEATAAGVGVGVIVHPTKLWTESGFRAGQLNLETGTSLRERLLGGELLQTSAVAVRRDLAVGTLFDPDLPIYEDWDFLFRCENQVSGGQTLIVPKVLSVHDARKRDGRLSNDGRAWQAGRVLLRKNLTTWSRSDRAAFMILRQITAELSMRSRLNRIRELRKDLALLKPITSKHLVSAMNIAFPKMWPVFSHLRLKMRGREGVPALIDKSSGSIESE